MKTTLDIPDHILRGAKARAALLGISMTKYVSHALEEKARSASTTNVGTPPWMSGFGDLADLHDETQRIDALIAAEFSEIDPEDQA